MHRALNVVMMGLALYSVIVPGIWYGYKERMEAPAPPPPSEPPRVPPPPRPTPPPRPSENEAPPQQQEEPEPEEQTEQEPEETGPVHDAHEAADQAFEELENLTRPV